MIIEHQICTHIKDLLVQGLPDIGGRVFVDQKFATDRRMWPAVLVWIPTATYSYAGHRVGSRPRSGALTLTVTVALDGNSETYAEQMTALIQGVDDVLGADPQLQGYDLTLTLSLSDLSRQAGAMIAVRQLEYSLTYKTRERETHELLSAR